MKTELLRISRRWALLGLLLTATLIMGAATTVSAAESLAPARVTGDFASAIVLDVNTGMILEAYREHERRPPASMLKICLLYTSPSPRDRTRSRMPSSA